MQRHFQTHGNSALIPAALYWNTKEPVGFSFLDVFSMAEEPAALAAESLPVPGQQHRNVRSLVQASPNLMHSQKTHLHTRGGTCE